jgi:hypothetical protein
MKINVVIKEPGKIARRVDVENDLETLQKLVGGYIETVSLFKDLVIICNEDGRLLNLPYCTTICGMDFVGTIIIAGVKGDKFASCPYIQLKVVAESSDLRKGGE